MSHAIAEPFVAHNPRLPVVSGQTAVVAEAALAQALRFNVEAESRCRSPWNRHRRPIPTVDGVHNGGLIAVGPPGRADKSAGAGTNAPVKGALAVLMPGSQSLERQRDEPAREMSDASRTMEGSRFVGRTTLLLRLKANVDDRGLANFAEFALTPRLSQRPGRDVG
ncbi:MAG: hypothetical protein K9L70_13895 [Thiohalocapsa sp.]|nr:hypothetical protein [Thiohalocapsa sp.]